MGGCSAAQPRGRGSSLGTGQGWLGGGPRVGSPTARHAGDASWDGARGVRDAGARRAREPLRTPRDVSFDHGVL